MGLSQADQLRHRARTVTSDDCSSFNCSELACINIGLTNTIYSFERAWLLWGFGCACTCHGLHGVLQGVHRRTRVACMPDEYAACSGVGTSTTQQRRLVMCPRAFAHRKCFLERSIVIPTSSVQRSRVASPTSAVLPFLL
jgi:hypothetical protein